MSVRSALRALALSGTVVLALAPSAAWADQGSAQAEGLSVVSTTTVHDSPAEGVEYQSTLSDGSTAVYGWRPDSASTASTDSTVSPASASGCNEDVCIKLVGEGTVVDEWTTTAYGNNGCVFANFIANNNYFLQTEDVCPDTSEPGAYYYTIVDRVFADGTEVCNTWYSFAGKPCEEIQA